jgi:tetratricopeptide (TPR) repeat protein
VLDDQTTVSPSRLTLPPVPESLADAAVAAWSEPVLIDTYLPADPDDYPAFLDTRVYQGSSGAVFPLPFHERIEQEKKPHEWQAVHLENRWIRLMILPELGGRIHVGYDKVADYDFFYRNNVIKPALVGLAGPWVSGGVEFNWPQHHRPATFLPVDVEIEHEDDGSVTVWCSDHDPMKRMKGMHGIRLRPDSTVIEARVRLVNRTETTQTFLWWANVAAAVNDDYQSFFPPDVRFVADHAKRAIATFPSVDGDYYGIDYPARRTPERPDGDRLDWYRNIPVPTSYMIVDTAEDFFGGYDHGREAGFVYWADHTIAPGKKQWTWGDAEFGRAWDANLTDDDGPYVELMAGAYTDNQPDFSYLTPGETKSFSQFWYPLHGIGPALHATLDGAVRLDVTARGDDAALRVGVSVTRELPDATIVVRSSTGVPLVEHTATLRPAEPLLLDRVVEGGTTEPLTIEVRDADGDAVLVWTQRTDAERPAPPVAATEPPAPADLTTVEELFLTGQYLHQYRHATRSPEPYWSEALRRDPGDVRSSIALAALRHDTARYAEAETLLRNAIARLVDRVPNPADGEAHYRLGLALVRLGRPDDAVPVLRKAMWNSAWRAPAALVLARLHSAAGEFAIALERLDEALAVDAENLQAGALRAAVLRVLGRTDEADDALAAILRVDPLDQWSRHLAGRTTSTDGPTLLDVAIEYASSGFPDEALDVFTTAAAAAAGTALGQVQVAPLAHYHRAALLDRLGRHTDAIEAREEARRADARHCLPSRPEDVAALEAAVVADPDDARALSLLGSWYYAAGRADDAIVAWSSALAAPSREAHVTASAHRNLAIAEHNVRGDLEAALSHFDAARAAAPDDAKLLYEHDQLLARVGTSATARLERLEQRPDLVGRRDDLSVELAGLLTTVGRSDEALDLLAGRRFQPWEGGEGRVLGAWDDALLARADRAIGDGDGHAAVAAVRAALRPPTSLGEARHPLANVARLHLALGDGLALSGDDEGARSAWETAAASVGDFTDMSTRSFSVHTVSSITALRRLGRHDEADELTAGFGDYIDELSGRTGTIDYFATSLPTMLLFHDDPDEALRAEVVALRRALQNLTTPTHPQLQQH